MTTAPRRKLPRLRAALLCAPIIASVVLVPTEPASAATFERLAGLWEGTITSDVVYTLTTTGDDGPQTETQTSHFETTVTPTGTSDSAGPLMAVTTTITRYTQTEGPCTTELTAAATFNENGAMSRLSDGVSEYFQLNAVGSSAPFPLPLVDSCGEDPASLDHAPANWATYCDPLSEQGAGSLAYSPSSWPLNPPDPTGGFSGTRTVACGPAEFNLRTTTTANLRRVDAKLPCTIKGWISATDFSRRTKVDIRSVVSAEAVPVGQVLVRIDGQLARSLALSAADAGKSSSTLPRLPVGRHNLQLSFSGSSTIAPCATSTVKIKVRK